MILVTGSTGFIGQLLVKKLSDKGHKLRVIVRKKSEELSSNIEQFEINLEQWVTDDASSESLSNTIKNSFEGVDVLIHMAGIAHMAEDISIDRYRLINRDLTLKLASYANTHDVKRFIFLSTIKVNGDMTFSKYSHLIDPGQNNLPDYFESNLNYVPKDPYALSKYEAELALCELEREIQTTIFIIRPPLVWGSEAKGNIAKLKKLIKLSIPLPFKLVNNERSVISRENLCDFLAFISDIKKHNDLGNQTFLIADKTDISFADMIRNIAYSQKKKTLLFDFPVTWMIRLLNFMGLKRISIRIFGNLRIEKERVSKLTGWTPIE